MRSGAAELEVQKIDAHGFAVAAEQTEAAFHVPRCERGLADVDDVHHGDGCSGSMRSSGGGSTRRAAAGSVSQVM